MDESSFLNRSPRKARIEIIPLIDVVFFLLATFVLFTLSLQRLGGLKLTFPEPGERELADTNVYVLASADGTFSWKQGRDSPVEVISKSELFPRFQDYLKRTSATTARVLVNVDDRAGFGTTVNVMDEARRAGISQVSIETSGANRW